MYLDPPIRVKGNESDVLHIPVSGESSWLDEVTEDLDKAQQESQVSTDQYTDIPKHRLRRLIQNTRDLILKILRGDFDIHLSTTTHHNAQQQRLT